MKSKLQTSQVCGTFLLYRGQEHLVYHSGIKRIKPLSGIGFIPLLLSPSVDLWNSNAHHNSRQLNFARGYAEQLVMKDFINILDQKIETPRKGGSFEYLDYFRIKEISADSHLSPIVDRMLYASGDQHLCLGQTLRAYPDLRFIEPSAI